MIRPYFQPGDLLAGEGPHVLRAEFTIAEAGDVDPRCACRFVEFDEAGGAVFAWNKDCVTHPKLPGGGVALW